VICSFLSTEVDKVECFKECPFFQNINEEVNCLFMVIEKSTIKRQSKNDEDYEYLFSIYDNYNI